MTQGITNSLSPTSVGRGFRVRGRRLLQLGVTAPHPDPLPRRGEGGAGRANEQLVDRHCADGAGPAVLGGRRPGRGDGGAAAGAAQPRRPAARAVAGRPAGRAGQSDAAPGGAREPRQHRHRRARREPEPEHRRTPRADAGHQERAGNQARRHQQSAGALGVLVQADRRGGFRHAPVHRSQLGARQHAAGPARRRHHGHRRPGARRAEIAARAGLRCAGARAADRQARRVRPPHRDHQGAALRHRRREEGELRASAGPRARRRRAQHPVPRGRGRPPSVTGRHRAGAHPPRGPQRRAAPRADRPHRDGGDGLPARRPEHRRDRGRGRAGRADAGQQPRGDRGRGRAREPARAAGVGRAARRRAHLAQPAALGRRRRPRAFHHSASAAEAGRHAHPPALADRLPDARAVLGQDQLLRPHHLRPLPAPRYSAAAVLREHRPLRGAGRCAAGRGRRRLRRRHEPVAHAAVGGAAGDAHRAPAGAAVQGQAVG